MRCTFKCLHIKEKGEIITPTSITFIFKSIHPLSLSLIKMLPPKNFVPDIFFIAGRTIPSSCCEGTDRSREELCWKQLKLQPVPKIDVKNPAGSSSLHDCPRHGNRSTISTLIRQFFSHLLRPEKETLPSDLVLSPAHLFPGPPSWLGLAWEFIFQKCLQNLVVNLHRSKD